MSADAAAKLTALEEFAQLYLREKDLEAKLADVKAKRAAMAQRAEDELLASGLTRAPLAVGATVYRDTKLYAGAARLVDENGDPTDKPDTERAIAALDAAGMGDYAKRQINTQGLSAHFKRERDALEQARRDDLDAAEGGDVLAADTDLDELLPPELQGAIRLVEVHTLKAVKSG